MVRSDRLLEGSRACRYREIVNERLKRLPMNGDPVAEPALHDRVAASDEAAETTSIDDEGLAPVAGPTRDTGAKGVDLRLPRLVSFLDRVRADDEHVDIAVLVSIATGGAPKDRYVSWGDHPTRDGLSEPLHEATAQADQSLESWPREMSAVRDIERHAGMFVSMDQALLHESGENELDTANTTDTGEPVDLTPGETSGRGREDLEHRSVQRGNNAADRMRNVHA